MVLECCTALIDDAFKRIEAQPTQALTLHDLLLQGHAWLLRPCLSLNQTPGPFQLRAGSRDGPGFD